MPDYRTFAVAFTAPGDHVLTDALAAAAAVRYREVADLLTDDATGDQPGAPRRTLDDLRERDQRDVVRAILAEADTLLDLLYGRDEWTTNGRRSVTTAADGGGASRLAQAAARFRCVAGLLTALTGDLDDDVRDAARAIARDGVAQLDLVWQRASSPVTVAA